MKPTIIKLQLILLLCTLSFSVFAQQPYPEVLIGDARNYGDSIVMRWNGNTPNGLLYYQSSTIVIQRMQEGDTVYTTLAEQKGIPPENWDKTLDVKNQQILLAAGSLQQLKQSAKIITIGIPEQIEADNKNKFLWGLISLAADLNSEAATALNLRFTDRSVTKKVRYFYKIFAKSDDKSIISDTLFFHVGTLPFKPKKPAMPQVIENEFNVQLQFPINKEYSGYFIEKSIPGKGDFIKLNTHPLVGRSVNEETAIITYTDSLKENYVPYEYRIKAVDMFGDPTYYSYYVQAMGRDRTPPPLPTGLKVFENQDGTLTFKWNKVTTNDGEKSLSIGLKHRDYLDYTILNEKPLPLSTESYTVKIKPDEDDYFFVLQVFDTAGNFSTAQAFYLLNDSIGPEKPTGLKAITDKNGVVKLTWNMNKEKDLDGYLIYFSNSPNTEFGGIKNKPLYDSIYADTLSLRMLNRFVYYRIQAVDMRFNKSPMSDIIKVLRPDTLAPVAPFINNYTISDTAIQLRWIRSSSVDAVEQKLYRKHVLSDSLVSIALEPSDTFYSDNKILSGHDYMYYLKAIDDSRNISPPSNVVSLRTYKNIYKEEVKVLVGTYDSISKSVKIEWNYPDNQVARIALYKGDSLNNVTIMPADILPTNRFYIDKKIKKDNVYFYAIKIFFRDGTQTRLSSPIEVQTYFEEFIER
jgi:hypothetical protein